MVQMFTPRECHGRHDFRAMLARVVPAFSCVGRQPATHLVYACSRCGARP
jgi:hypothetical protein